MRCYDGVENFELVGYFILQQVGRVIDKNDIALYRDNDLQIFCGISKPMTERKKQETVKAVRQCGLSITPECNSKTVNVLDITFDL